jgi:protein-tyrosine phosphatase
MRTELYWVEDRWPGKLAVAPRPRGGDWLEDEVANWQAAGVNEVVSLLTTAEEVSLDLNKEKSLVIGYAMDFVSFPIPDRQVPRSQHELAVTLEKLNTDLSSGKNVLIHCRQGIGRTGLVAACLLVSRGINPSAAVDIISAARGIAVPETLEQHDWIDRYAAALAGTQ